MSDTEPTPVFLAEAIKAILRWEDEGELARDLALELHDIFQRQAMETAK
jgi:hypothetical protein